MERLRNFSIFNHYLVIFEHISVNMLFSARIAQINFLLTIIYPTKMTAFSSSTMRARRRQNDCLF